MKQYTNESQTAKLIELGLPKPRYYCADKYTIIHTGFDIINYSIGELIEIIDSKVTLEIDKLGARWMVSVLIFDFTGTELIDCLFDACVKLREEGVI